MKKQSYILMSLLLAMCLSACGSMQESLQQEVTMQDVTTQEEAQDEVQEQQEQEVREPAEEETAVLGQSAIPPMDLSGLNLQYEQQEEFKKLYDQIQPVENAEDFEGTWSRTDTASSLSAEITITEQSEDGFSFVGDFYYYSHSGWMEGNAKFAAPNVAVFEYMNEWDGEVTTSEYLVFEKTQDGMKVYASAASADLGFGMNVSADGYYVQGEPVYTNATVFDDNFTPEVQAGMQTLLGDNYEDYFKFPVEMGILTSTTAALSDGSSAIYYEVFVPTMGGYSFELLVCDNGELYFYSEAGEVGWKTNVEGAIDFPLYVLEENE